MRLFEIALPRNRNKFDARDYMSEHRMFQRYVLETAGGFTQLPAANGVWSDDGKTYMDLMICYRVALANEDAPKWSLILAKAFELFEDQIAIMHSEIGTAEITYRNAAPVIHKEVTGMAPLAPMEASHVPV